MNIPHVTSLGLVVTLIFAGAPTPASAAFPGENGKIVFDGGCGLESMNPDSSDRVLLGCTDGFDVNSPQVAPDGRTLLASEWSTEGGLSDSGSGSIDVLSRLNRTGRQPVRLASATLGSGGRFAGTEVTNEIHGGSVTDLVVVDSDGTVKHPGATTDRSEFLPRFSPNASRIAFMRSDPTGAVPPELWISDLDGSNPLLLATGPGLSSFDFSPDGTKLVYASEGRLFTIGADGSSPTQITDGGTAAVQGGDQEPAFSPDGKQIVFSRFLGYATLDRQAIYMVNSDGSGVRRLLYPGPRENFSQDRSPVWAPVSSDTDRPETTIKPTGRRDGQFRFKVRSDEPESVFNCKIDELSWKFCESPFKRRVKRVSPGRHVLRARAIDGSTNVDPKPAKVKFNLE